MPDFPFAPIPINQDKFCRKCCGIENIQLVYNAGPSTGHCCNVAIFDAFIYINESQQVYLGEVNLNNGDTCEEVYRTLTITAQTIEDMTRNIDDESCCKFYARLSCATPLNEDRGFGPGQCHTGIAQLRIKKQNAQGEYQDIFENVIFAGESPVEIDACPFVN
jgi:hypothetical protein